MFVVFFFVTYKIVYNYNYIHFLQTRMFPSHLNSISHMSRTSFYSVVNFKKIVNLSIVSLCALSSSLSKIKLIFTIRLKLSIYI